MNKPPSDDPCVAIEDAVAETEGRIQADLADLENPDIPARRKEHARKDLEEAREEQTRLEAKLRDCRAAHPDE